MRKLLMTITAVAVPGIILGTALMARSDNRLYEFAVGNTTYLVFPDIQTLPDGPSLRLVGIDIQEIPYVLILTPGKEYVAEVVPGKSSAGQNLHAYIPLPGLINPLDITGLRINGYQHAWLYHE